MRFAQPIVLASRSPRRKQLLEEAGIRVHVLPPHLDDGELTRQGQTPEQWVLELALLKALDVLQQVSSEKELETGTVLAADTVCVHGSEIFGQPADAAEALAMLQALRDNTHYTISGVCLINIADDSQHTFVDKATVHFGHVDDAEIDAYIQSESWRGKAGGYNLVERIDAGWPIRCDGDPTTVMGLPMQRLRSLLNGVGREQR